MSTTTEPHGKGRILRVHQVKREKGIHPNTIALWEEAGLFPKRRKFGPNIVGWWEREFDQALDDYARRTDGGEAA
jgi:predicted DNA-binding transcriptional regulator AlpA